MRKLSVDLELALLLELRGELVVLALQVLEVGVYHHHQIHSRHQNLRKAWSFG